MESVKALPAKSVVGGFRNQVAARRGNKNIAAVAAARRQLEYVYYALRDGHVRALTPTATASPATAGKVA